MTKTVFELSIEEKQALYKDIVRNWGKESPVTIAGRHGVKRHTVSGIASRVRKVGIPLPRLGIKFLDEEFIKELQGVFTTRPEIKERA